MNTRLNLEELDPRVVPDGTYLDPMRPVDPLVPTLPGPPAPPPLPLIPGPGSPPPVPLDPLHPPTLPPLP